MCSTGARHLGDAIAETDGTGSTSNSNYHEYVFFAGRRIARSDPSSGNVYFYFADQLGTTRSVTQANGTVCFSADYYPYGEEVDYTTSCPQNYKFTGYERDAETGLDYAFNRHYNSRMARFMSADSWGGVVGAPQSHNAYSYVVNNPVVLVDRLGTCPGGFAENRDLNQPRRVRACRWSFPTGCRLRGRGARPDSGHALALYSWPVSGVE